MCMCRIFRRWDLDETRKLHLEGSEYPQAVPSATALVPLFRIAVHVFQAVTHNLGVNLSVGQQSLWSTGGDNTCKEVCSDCRRIVLLYWYTVVGKNESQIKFRVD